MRVRLDRLLQALNGSSSFTLVSHARICSSHWSIRDRTRAPIHGRGVLVTRILAKAEPHGLNGTLHNLDVCTESRASMLSPYTIPVHPLPLGAPLMHPAPSASPEDGRVGSRRRRSRRLLPQASEGVHSSDPTDSHGPGLTSLGNSVAW